MKEEGAEIFDLSICAFNHHKIYKLKSYYSRGGAPSGDGYNLIEIYGSQSLIGQYYIGSNNDKDPNDEWQQDKYFYPFDQNYFKNNYDTTIWD